MDRRAVLRVVALGATGVAGCVGTESDGPAATTDSTKATTDGTRATTHDRTSGTPDTTSETDSQTTVPETDDSTPTRTATDTPEATTGRCGASELPDARRRVHSDYGLRIVGETDDPAVAVVGDDWRSALRVSAMSDADGEFVADTDFDRSVLLVVQYRESGSANRLRVTDLTTDGDTVRADLCVVTRSGPNDAPTANLFVRVPYSGTPPSRARVRIRKPTGPATVTGG